MGACLAPLWLEKKLPNTAMPRLISVMLHVHLWKVVSALALQIKTILEFGVLRYDPLVAPLKRQESWREELPEAAVNFACAAQRELASSWISGQALRL